MIYDLINDYLNNYIINANTSDHSSLSRNHDVRYGVQHRLMLFPASLRWWVAFSHVVTSP